jgi:hypothetical protein
MHADFGCLRTVRTVLTSVLLVFGGGAMADPPTAPADMFVRAAPTSETFEVRVTWADVSGETFYEVVRHPAPSPGPIIVSQAAAPILGPGWERIALLDQDATEFVHETVQAGSYGVCATAADDDIACWGPSGFALPRVPPEPARIDRLQVFLRGVDRLGFEWAASANTVFTRVTLRRGAAEVQSLEPVNRSSLTFFELPSNTPHEITVCVRNAAQTAANETCRSVTSSTLPALPLAVQSLEVVPGDPDPVGRSLRFVFDNRSATAVRGILVNLIREDAVVDTTLVIPGGFGVATHTVRFGDLTPFTGYEAWVLPYNESGVGTAAGIGFTTPVALLLEARPLSGDSVLLRWSETAAGTYGLERFDGANWVERAQFLALEPGPRAVVLEGAGAQVRLTWRLATLRSVSEPIAATPLAFGAPELVSVRRSVVGVGEPRRFVTRHAVTFRTTRAGAGPYELERLTTQGWRSVAATEAVASLDADAMLTLRDDSQPPTLASAPLTVEHRVCRVQPGSGRQTSRRCSAPTSLASTGVVRVD